MARYGSPRQAILLDRWWTLATQPPGLPVLYGFSDGAVRLTGSEVVLQGACTSRANARGGPARGASPAVTHRLTQPASPNAHWNVERFRGTFRPAPLA